MRKVFFYDSSEYKPHFWILVRVGSSFKSLYFYYHSLDSFQYLHFDVHGWYRGAKKWPYWNFCTVFGRSLVLKGAPGDFQNCLLNKNHVKIGDKIYSIFRSSNWHPFGSHFVSFWDHFNAILTYICFSYVHRNTNKIATQRLHHSRQWQTTDTMSDL